jgi:hypothetical protein
MLGAWALLEPQPFSWAQILNEVKKKEKKLFAH